MSSTPLKMLIGNNHNQTSGFNYLSFMEIAKKAEQPYTSQADDIKAAKETAPICAPYDAPKKTKEAVLEHNNFTMLWADLDSDNQKLEATRERLIQLGIGSFVIYSTAKSAPNEKRWRVLIEISHAIGFEQWHTLQSYLAYVLNGDKAATRAQQILYLPFKCEATQHYDYSISEGEALNPEASELTAKAITYRQEQEAEAQQKAQEAPPKPKPSVSLASGQQSPIELFNAAYSMEQMLDYFKFKRVGKKYIHPESQSGKAGVVLLDNRYYSHHSSDPLADGYTHDAFDLFVHFEHDGNFDAAVKEAANQLDVEGQNQRQTEYAKEQAEAVAIERAMQPETRQHLLTIPINLDDKPQPPKWVVNQFIAEGVVIIAGGHGVGKTTAILPLACTVAGVAVESELKPKHWRHVVYITEDVEQAKRIIEGYCHSLSGWNMYAAKDAIKERVHIVEAHRMEANIAVLAGETLKERYTRTITAAGFDKLERTVELLPLVVIDTMAATISLENENDNAEASQAIAAFKQRFAGLPVWIIGHVSKSNLNRENAASGAPTLRGATAFEADANQVLYLVKEGNGESATRWLVRGKTRFESPWPELEIISDHTTIEALNRFGEFETLTLRWSVAQAPTATRQELLEQAKERAKENDQQELERRLIMLVGKFYEEGKALNKTGLKSLNKGNGQKVTDTINKLILEGWLYEVEIPKAVRLPNKASFLISLTGDERKTLLETGKPPIEKTVIPPYLQKPEKGTARNGTADLEAKETA